MTTKILIIRFSSIGDIVLTSPVIRCLKQQMDGETEVHYITKKKFSCLLEANPYLTKVHVIENNVSEVIDELKALHFNYVIDLHCNIRSSQIKRQLKTLAFTVNKINRQKWLMVNFKINRLPDVHIVDRYMETMKALSIHNDGKGLDYFIPASSASESTQDESILSSLPETHPPDGRYIAFSIGGTYETKKLPVEKIISICKKISKPIVLLGGQEDIENGKKIKAMAGQHIYNACGKCSINQSATLIRNAEKVISHDTGMMHIAAAFKKEVISVWGNTIPEFGMSPYYGTRDKGQGTIVEVKELKCRPCTKLGYGKCPKKHFYCMNLINEDEIVEAIMNY